MNTDKHYADLLVPKKPRVTSADVETKIQRFINSGGKIDVIPTGVSGVGDRNNLELYDSARKKALASRMEAK